MAITPLPNPPSTSDPANFEADADAFIAALPQFVEEANETAAAMTLNATSGTSATSHSVGTGAKTFTADTGKSWQPGMFIVIADTATPSTNSMLAQITSYNSGTGALVVDVKSTLGSGTKTAWTISQTANPVPLDNSVATASLQDGSVRGTKMTAKLQDIDASVASNALTITINPTTLDFRSTTLTDGTPTTVNLASAVTVVVPDTATLGTVNAVAARLAVLAINNAGTIEAAVVNLAGGNRLDETNLISTTAIDTGADSSNVIYSTSARTSVAYRVVGFIDITEATAGTWATAPALVQGRGGEALAALSSIGYGQTWQNMTASRALATTYYNTTGKPIQIHVAAQSLAAAYPVLTITQNGVSVILIGSYNNSTGVPSAITAVIPAGAAYVVGMNTGTASLTPNGWLELR